MYSELAGLAGKKKNVTDFYCCNSLKKTYLNGGFPSSKVYSNNVFQGKIKQFHSPFD